MQVAVGSFRCTNSITSGTVNITDADGSTFTPQYIFEVNSSSELNVLWTEPTGFNNTCSMNQNFVRASDLASAFWSMAEHPQFGVKICSTGGGTGTNAGLDSLQADAFFGGNIYRVGSITGVGDGFFTYSMLQVSLAYNTDVIYIALAGVSIEALFIGGTGTYSTSFDPKGLIHLKMGAWSTSGSIATGAGGGNMGWGFDSPNGGAFGLAETINNQATGNYRYQAEGFYNAGIGTVPVVTAAKVGAVTNWGTNQLTSLAASTTVYVIGGTNILTATGRTLLRSTVGSQRISCTIQPYALFINGINSTSDDTLLSDYAELCAGFSNGVDQASLWLGESVIAQPLKGANYISADSLLRFTTSGANGSSTTFGTTVSINNFSPYGWFDIDILTADAVDRYVSWIVIGVAAIPIPPTPTHGGGIYVLVPEKRQDTIWLDTDPEDTALFKIPDPHAITFFAGDE